MNTITLLGRTTADLELKQMNTGKSVTNFSLAVKRPFCKDTTDFIGVVAYGEKAEILGKYIHKGDQVCIRGYLTVRKWQDKDGNNRYATEVVAEEISFVGSKESPTEAKNDRYTPDAYKTQTQFEPVDNEQGLPF